MPASALLVTGTVGVGKSVTANMIGSLLQARLVPHAVIDLDEIRRRWPAPPDDPFDFELELRNLQPMATNYLAAGARRLVMAGVCESRQDRDRLAVAVGVPLIVCRRKGLSPLLAGVQAWSRSSSGASHNDKAVRHRFDGL